MLRSFSGGVARPAPLLSRARPQYVIPYDSDLGPADLTGFTLLPSVDGVTHQSAAAFVSDIALPDWTGEVLGDAEGEGNVVHGYALGDPLVKPPIMLLSGVHGDEWQAAWGTRRFCEYLDDPDASPNPAWFAFLRDRYAWFWIPVGNPSGFTANTRRNVNDVDINRDYQDLTQAETALIRGEAERLKPVGGIDCHTYNGPPHAIASGMGPTGAEYDLFLNTKASLQTLWGDTVGEYTPHPDAPNRFRSFIVTQDSVRGVKSLAFITEAARVFGSTSMAHFVLNALLMFSIYTVQWDLIHHD